MIIGRHLLPLALAIAVASSFAVTNAHAGSCNTPTITTQPLSQSVNSGHPVTLRVEATAYLPGFTYQWYQGLSGDTSTPVGTNSYLFTTTPSTTTSYWVRVTNCGGFVDSATATVTTSPRLCPEFAVHVDYPAGTNPSA